MSITSKSTKAEILAAYNELSSELWETHQAYSTQTVTLAATRNTAEIVWTELVNLIRDTYLLGCWCRKGFDRVVDELRACC